MTVTVLHDIIIIIIHHRQHLKLSHFVSLQLVFSVTALCCLVVVTQGVQTRAASIFRVGM
jgi:hypothetical protein